MARTFPEALPDIASVAAVLGDQSRAAMCTALMDGRAWTAGELAAYCHLRPPSATKHIDRLVKSGIVSDVRQGRRRYLRLVNDDVARVIEQLGVVASAALPTAGGLRTVRTTGQIRAGRTCYKHLAGRLGVELADRMRGTTVIDSDWRVTRTGESVLSTWGINDPASVESRPCMDSTERRFHLAGRLGQEVCSALMAMNWVERIGGTRAVRLTATGRAQLFDCGLMGAPAVERQGGGRTA